MTVTVLEGCQFGEGIHWEMPGSSANTFGAGSLPST